jgi:SAM-dependent methyltransferase
VEIVKRQLLRLLRKLGILPLAERARFKVLELAHARSNRAFLTEHPDAILPPGFLIYDAYGHIDYRTYLGAGRPVAEYLAATVARYHGSETPVSVCEWGCGPARILRHLPGLLPAGSRVFGTDYNAKTIEWCSAHLKQVTFQLHGLAPPLPFSTGELDLLYAVSVLTHLSEDMHHAWMAECVRVVRPGGLILLTVHGDRCTGGLSPHERQSYEAGQLVVRGRVREGSRMFIAYQSPRFMREVLLPGLEILLHNPLEAPAHAGAQDVYLIRTRAREPEAGPRRVRAGT